MKTILVIGMTGEGKSPWIRNYIHGRNCLVFDIQNEYGNRTKYKGQSPVGLSTNTSLPRSRYIGTDISEFLDIVALKKNTVCVFEEATVFFEGRTNDKTRSIMINKMHTGNVYIFVFHSISAVPPRIMQLCDYIVLFKTNDEPYQVERKYPTVAGAYNELRSKEKGSKQIIKRS